MRVFASYSLSRAYLKNRNQQSPWNFYALLLGRLLRTFRLAASPKFLGSWIASRYINLHVL